MVFQQCLYDTAALAMIAFYMYLECVAKIGVTHSETAVFLL